ncbi:amidase [Kribbella sp. WER1]
MSDLHDLSAVELGRAIAAGELTAVEVTEHYLDRIERLDPTVGAFVTVDPGRALEHARQVRRGSPLAGVPTGIKDLDLTAGVRTTMGSAAFAQYVPAEDQPSVRRLKDAGVVALGKTATPEFGLVCYTEPEGRPPTRTPWDLDRSPSGSSGGAAAAVAAGLVPWAPGSDGGGSVRTPASTCGLVGLKPSRGRCGQYEAAGFSVPGPLTRTVADAAAALDVMAGPYAGDMDRVPVPTATFLEQARPIGRRLRVARCTTPINRVPVDQACLDAVEVTTRQLLELGHEVEEIDCPFPEGMDDHFLTVWTGAAVSLPLPPEVEQVLRPITRWFRDRGRALSVAEYNQSLTYLRQLAVASIAATAEYDVVLTPTLAQVPRRIGALRNDDDPAAEWAAIAAFSSFTPAYNVSGQPAISLPLCEDGGIPIGVQFVGRPYDEVTLLQLAAQLEAAMPWRGRKPVIW